MSYNIVVCASCGGGNFKAILESRISIGYTVTRLIVDRVCGAIEIAKKYGIDTQIIPCKNNNNYERDFIRAIPQNTNLIVLAGYMPILPNVICQTFEHKIINTHPSLLPKYGGRGMYGVKVQEAVMAAKEKYAGCTIHYVNGGIDTGEIILQKKILVNYDDTPWQLGGKIFLEENILLPQAIGIIKKQISHNSEENK